MTLIQPNKDSSFLNIILVALSVAVTGAVICLIFVYNQKVSFDQGAVALKEQTIQLQAENSELKTRTFALLDPERLASIAAAQGMSAGATPHYVPIPTWVAASHF